MSLVLSPANSQIGNHLLHTQTPHICNYRNTRWENYQFALSVYLWVGSAANLASYSYQCRPLHQNHTAGWMSQGFVRLKKPSSWLRGKKKTERVKLIQRHTALKDNKYLSEDKLRKTAAGNKLQLHRPDPVFLCGILENNAKLWLFELK